MAEIESKLFLLKIQSKSYGYKHLILVQARTPEEAKNMITARAKETDDNQFLGAAFEAG
jgi:hypothetical protein